MKLDFRTKKYTAAVAKLEKAIDLCGKQCSPKLVAKLNRDLGVVHVAGLDDAEEGRAAFIMAVTADPTITLDKEFTTEKVQDVFDEVKSAVGQADASKKKEEAAKREAEQAGLVHEPPKEGMVLTGLPIWAELESGSGAKALKVRYKNAEGEWATVAMKPVAGGYGAEIPCKGVGSVPRVLEYFIQGYVGQDVVAHSGSRNDPRTVPIKRKLDGPAPSLPGEEPPKQCMDECPPGMEACATREGGECDNDEACSAGLSCVEGVCGKPKEQAPKMGKRTWVSLVYEQDWMIFPAENDICSGGNAYVCFWANDTEYTGLPNSGTGLGNQISENTIRAVTKRVLLSIDLLLAPHWSAGARLGFSFGRGPREYSPLHFEPRLAYWFRSRTSVTGLFPYAALSTGYAWMEGRYPVKVSENTADFFNPNTGEYELRTLSAWRASGPLFASLAFGALFEIDPGMRQSFDPRFGLFLEVKATEMFINPAFAMSGLGGVSVGF